MKFGHHLTTHVTPEWRTQYINYDAMKSMILQAKSKAFPDPNGSDGHGLTTPVDQPSSPDTQKFLEEFQMHYFDFCEQELKKVNTFYSEKLAEAQRKFAALKAELRAHKGKAETNGLTLTKQEERIRQKTPWFVEFVDKDARRAKRRFRKIHDLKLAFSEFYLSLILLQNFQNLNFTGFRKILKKHDKMLHTDHGANWRKENVETSFFHLNKDVDGLILETENLVTNELESGDRGRAMRRLRVPPLNEQASASVFFLMGLFLGIFLVLLVVLMLTGFFIGLPYNEYTAKVNGTNGTESFVERKEKTDWRIVIRLYRGPFLLIAMLFLIAFNVHGWRAAGVNHVLIFELDPRNHLSQHHMMELAACLGVLWCISLLIFFYSDFLGIAHYAIPLIVGGIMFVFLVNPIHVLFYDARRWLMRTTFRIITAPFHTVSFADFWLADQFTSVTTAFLDIEYFICFYAIEVPWLTGGVPMSSGKCTSNTTAIRPIIAALPAWFRFAQCLRRYRDSRLAFPHLVNASRYSLTFFVVLFSALNSMHIERYVDDYIGERPVFYLWIISAVLSSCFSFWWDIRMDWGFSNKAKEHPLLRDSLIYASSWYYYAAIFEDFVLRFAWAISTSVNELGLLHHEIILTVLTTTEIIRRFIWNFFRLENEHLNNCGAFRAVRDIAVHKDLGKVSSSLLGVREEPTEHDAFPVKKESSRKFHSIWKMDQEEAAAAPEAHPGASAELFPISIPDPSYNPDEEEDDKGEEVLITVDQA